MVGDRVHELRPLDRADPVGHDRRQAAALEQRGEPRRPARCVASVELARGTTARSSCGARARASRACRRPSQPRRRRSSAPLHAASSSSLATPFWKETAMPDRRPARAARAPSAVAVSGVFVSRTTISAGSIRSGRQSARSGTSHRSPNESTVTAPRAWIARACSSRARSCTSSAGPSERGAVDRAERPGADDDGAFLAECAHSASNSSTSRPRVPPASSRRWASAASAEP